VQTAVGESIDRKLQHHCSAMVRQESHSELGDSTDGLVIAKRIYLSLKRGKGEELDQMLQEGIDILEEEVNRQKSEPQYRWLYEFHLTIQEIDTLIPAQDAFIFISWYQWGADQLIAGRHAVPFIGRNGEYLGPRENDDIAVQELEALRRSGVRFIVFGSPAFWWLEYYTG